MKRPALLALLVGLSVAVLVGGCYFAVELPQRAKLAAHSKRLDEQLVRRAQGKPRVAPPPEGDLAPGDALDAVLAAAQGLDAADPKLVEAISAELRDGKPIAADHAPELDRLAERIDTFRKSSRHESVRLADASRGVSTPFPSYQGVLRATKLALARADQAPGDRCLVMVADVAHITHAIALQGRVIAHMVSAAIAKQTGPVAARCAFRARGEPLQRGLEALERIAAASAPIGTAIEHEMLSMAFELRPFAQSSSLLPLKGSSIPIDTSSMSPGTTLRAFFTQRNVLLEAWGDLMNDADRFGKLGPADLPAAIDQVDREMQTQVDRNPVMQSIAMSYRSLMQRAAELLVHERLTTTAVRVRVIEMTQSMSRGGAVMIAVSPPTMRDPFSTQPLRFRPASASAPYALYSVGPNGVDDRGAPGSDDIVLALPDQAR